MHRHRILLFYVYGVMGEVTSSWASLKLLTASVEFFPSLVEYENAWKALALICTRKKFLRTLRWQWGALNSPRVL